MLQNKQWTARKLVFLIGMVIFSIGLGGCAAAPAPQPLSPMMGSEAAAAEGGAVLRYQAVAPAAAIAPAGEAMADAAVAQGIVQDGGAFTRKVIARATMNLVVDDTEQVVEQIQQMMDTMGGYVANANLYKSDYGAETRLQGTLTLRIPAEQLEAAMAQLEALAVDVNNKTINREDVTDQYSDVEAQLRNLEATEVELRAMLAEVRAKPNAKPEDILAVYSQLSNIRGQIEQLQGRKNMLDNLVGLSSLDLTLTPNFVTLPVVEAGWQPVVVARDALRELVNTMQGLGSLVIWVGIYLLPILVVLLVAGVIVWSVLRALWRLLRRRRAVPAS